MHATEGIRRIHSAAIVSRSWPLADVAIASVGVVLAIGFFLLFRRAVGALSAPLPAGQLAATAGLLLLWAILAHALLKRRLRPAWAVSLPLAALVLFAVACSYPDLRVIDWAAWITAIVAFVLTDHAWRIVGRRRNGQRGSAIAAGEVDDGQVIQQLTRYRTAGGQDVVRGAAAAEFTPGERSTMVYVAFCPPFERLPDVETEVVGDSTAVVKLVQVLHNGIQLEVRLAKAAHIPHQLKVEFFAAEPVEVA